jgi:hypothetical protein
MDEREKERSENLASLSIAFTCLRSRSEEGSCGQAQAKKGDTRITKSRLERRREAQARGQSGHWRMMAPY